MCELLGMSANVPTDICFSFSGLMQRGGVSGPHRDGWGITFYEGKGCRSFHDPNPSANSEVAKLVQRHSMKSNIVISHIRQANVGNICLENTHPFQRELWGQHWTFAHNGQLNDTSSLTHSHYLPVGDTDSEHVFCWLLGELRTAFPKPPYDVSAVRYFIMQRCQFLKTLGVFNMLLSDGIHLYCFCSTKLSWITRRAPFGEASLSDADVNVDFGQETTPNDIVSVVATEPLTSNETWTTLQPGQMLVLKNGLVLP
jgi:glutamine amidotransferase